MAVLINMGMPQNCAECPCIRHDNLDGIDGYQCNLTLDTWDVNDNERWTGRGSNCPLVNLSDGLYQVERWEGGIDGSTDKDRYAFYMLVLPDVA